jgi:hypothetical protein
MRAKRKVATQATIFAPAASILYTIMAEHGKLRAESRDAACRIVSRTPNGTNTCRVSQNQYTGLFRTKGSFTKNALPR